MRRTAVLAAGVLTLSTCAFVQAAEISGEYLEARTCDVYTGPCFANAEVGVTGKEAMMAWKVDEGSWAGQDLSGLGVALIITANDTLGFGGGFNLNPDKIVAMIVVDEKANAEQAQALIKFVKENAKNLTTDVVKVEKAAITLTNDHLAGTGVFTAGKLAKIETRKLSKGDCVCTNEDVVYPPLTKVDNAHVAFTVDMSFSGKGLDSTWSNLSKRSAFLATFER